MSDEKDFDAYCELEGLKMAEKFSKNATEEDVNNVRDNMWKMNRGPLAKIWDKVTSLWSAFTSPETSKGIKAWIIGALIYMISPVDLVPDVIPFVGLLDDASVIGLAYSKYMQLVNMANQEENGDEA